MYAIVKTGGKQYRVEPGQRLLVERLRAAEGETVSLQPVMYRADEIVCDGEALAKVEVSARVLAHERGQKLRVFKFKPKRGYRRRTGHRQELTRIEVTDIALGGAGAAKAAAAKAPKAAAGAAAAKKPRAAAEPAATEGKPKADAKPAAAEKKAKATAAKPAAAGSEKPKESSDGS